ncbi:cuticle protein CP1876-like [Portunus trituberculatus]|uniref:cuticle protein CP1876-like n=1 Tax=Portunus trituberculatus TaxID=210409 RepID=UPI001E1D0A4A|nr:cuticle protein CP1876-like [Portunus trituberculatus]
MRTLVVLAVMVAVSAHQAYGIPTYGTPAHSTHSYGYGQPRYVGPLASSVPAGVGGKIIPVSDTYEVAAAKNQFFRTYQDQVNTINAIRASRPTRYGTSYGSAGPVHISHPAPAPTPAVVSTYSGPARVSHSISAPVHVFQSSYGAPAVSHSSYGTPSYAPFTAPTQVSDTPEVAAAKPSSSVSTTSRLLPPLPPRTTTPFRSITEALHKPCYFSIMLHVFISS